MNNIYVHYKKTKPQNINTISVEDAVIEEVYKERNKSGYILISYGMKDEKDIVHMQQLRLNISPQTVIHSPFGEEITIYELEKGMHINATFSTAMTRSIPPQSQAFLIYVLPSEEFVSVTSDRVAEVDLKNRFMYTGNPNDINDQMRFVITDSTIILDRDGNRIRLNQVHPGQMVRVEHANFQTASIPPQTTAFRVYLR